MKDPVTDLFNRQHCLHILAAEIGESREHGVPLGLVLVDIRSFHRINRLYGYAAGDRVLQAVAELLKEVCREQDQLARIGDDQFAMILPGIMNEGHAQLAAFKIQRLLGVPLQIETSLITCTAAIGVALSPAHAKTAAGLLEQAELALQRAKQLEQPVSVAPEQDQDESSENWHIEIALEESIRNDQLRVYFQPKISLATGKPSGAEALVRWDSDTHGLLSPDVFIPIAETIGFVRPMTEWMLNSALRLSGEWTTKWGPQEVSVNIPPRIMEQPDFVDIVMSARELWRPEGVTLFLEILEQSFIDDQQGSATKLRALREEQIGISIDDFGTGYSSLAYFRDIPADQLKIDRSFVAGLLKDKANANIVGLIVDLAHRFDLSVVAEGVEDIKTLAALKRMNCDVVQGYYFARPMPAQEYKLWLNNYRGISAKNRMAAEADA